MTATGADYQVVVTPSREHPDRFEYRLSRIGLLRRELDAVAARLGARVPEDFPAVVPIADLVSPACSREQALAFALAWLRIVEGVDPAEVELEFLFDPQPVRHEVSAEAYYGRMRAVWWRRVLRRQA